MHWRQFFLTHITTQKDDSSPAAVSLTQFDNFATSSAFGRFSFFLQDKKKEKKMWSILNEYFNGADIQREQHQRCNSSSYLWLFLIFIFFISRIHVDFSLFANAFSQTLPLGCLALPSFPWGWSVRAANSSILNQQHNSN